MVDEAGAAALGTDLASICASISPKSDRITTLLNTNCYLAKIKNGITSFSR